MGKQVGDDLVDGESEPVRVEDVVAFECLCEGFLGVEQLYVAVYIVWALAKSGQWYNLPPGYRSISSH